MRRTVGLYLAFGLVLPLVLAATAYGQGATLRVDDQTPAPGQTITINGSGFSSANANGPVYLRLDSRTAEPVTDAAPDSAGNIIESFPVPRNVRGWHLLIATQNTNLNGRATAATPGRVRLNVGAPQSGAAAPPAGGGRLPDSPLGLLALAAGLALLATGAALAGRHIRAHNRPRLGSQPR